MNYIPNIPDTGKIRVVIVGGGFAGLKLAIKLLKHDFQIILLDKNNYHQFQPLLYQVATAGLEPSAISFPVRKILQKEQNIHFRMADMNEIFPDRKEISTNLGSLKYDYLVIAMGVNTNFFGQERIEQNAMSMKTAADAILIRNTILENFEHALQETSPEKISEFLNVVLVGGGPTGVELAGALAEMKKYILPKDYPELDLTKMRIILYESSSRLLAAMSPHASRNAMNYLNKLGVEVHLGTKVIDYNGTCMVLSDGNKVQSRSIIWAAGVKAKSVTGIPAGSLGRGNRILVDRAHRIMGSKDIFAIGDISLMQTPKYPSGQPQLAQVAIQQSRNLARNLIKTVSGETSIDFEYRNKGALATIGRNLAVADLPFGKIKGFLAWVLWSFVHLFSIVGVKNRVFIFLNWSWNYFTYDQSLRLLIRHRPPNQNGVNVIKHKDEPFPMQKVG